MTPTDDQIRTAIAQQAADWLVANQSGSVGQKEHREFMEWLRTSPVHVREYLRLGAIAHDLSAVLVEPQISIEALTSEARADRGDTVIPFEPSQPHPMRARRELWIPRPRLATWIAAGAMAGAAVAFVWVTTPGRVVENSYSTAHGEQRAWKLSDGSSLQLDTDSTLRIHFSGEERRAELLRGRAYFQVAHDARRRFSVLVNEAEIVAHGTQFDVYRQGEVTLVTVAEGEVAVVSSSIGDDAPASGSLRMRLRGLERLRADAIEHPVPVLLRHQTLLRTGQQLRVESGIPSKPVEADLGQSLAWVRGRITFEHRPLGEVAEEFNRYARTPITISDSRVSKLLISGNFKVSDTDSFVRYLNTLADVRIVRATPGPQLKVVDELPPTEQLHLLAPVRAAPPADQRTQGAQSRRLESILGESGAQASR
jgi:transmembrane sensor